MKSGELAHMAGVSVRTLRHYHAIGLLPEPKRSSNGYREYEAEHLLRLLRIRQLASLGFSLDQIGPMLDELDAEREDEGDLGDELGAGAEQLLEQLDRQLVEQIAHLEHQRDLIRHIRARQTDPDYPERAASVLEAIDAFERQTDAHGFLLSALTDDDKIAMGIAAHLYSDGELAEIERIFRAIPERGLIDEYLRVSRLIDTLPGNASAEERERAINAGMAFLDKIADCMDTSNWLRPDKDYERMLENMAMVHYNDAQIAVSDELFLRFTDRLAQRNV
ncbi:MerR family transcriptional regulator [Collinsella sp.]|uniref:MerR family transcriptional regulator n=1 Tax=Collinsella sp. TaxID=1965294 RepID=UPI003FEF87DA